MLYFRKHLVFLAFIRCSLWLKERQKNVEGNDVNITFENTIEDV